VADQSVERSRLSVSFAVFSVKFTEKCCDACRDWEILIPVRFLRRHRVPEFERHRMPLTGSRWDIRWLIGRRTKRTFCVFPVFSVAVMEKCCDACRDGEYYFRSGFSASEGAGDFMWHRLPLTGSRWDIRWLIGRRTKPTFCVFPVFSVAVMEKCCDASLTGSTIYGQVFRRQRVPEFRDASIAVDRKSMGHTMADRSSNEADFLCIWLYLAWRLWKSVVTLVVRGDTISGQAFRRHRVPEFYRHRLPLTGSRWDIRWLIDR
jgi:hypothetical protein